MKAVDIITADKKAADSRKLIFEKPDIRVASFAITGNAPYVQNRFANKAEIMAKQSAGSTANKGTKKEAKDFDECYLRAQHRSTEGWIGIPAGSFRAGMISACRLVGFKMTLAKLSVFVECDGYDVDGNPLIKLEGEPEMHTAYVRNDTGVIDIRARPMFKQWSCVLRVRYDAHQFTVQDIANLLARVGAQVGIGEGRPDSKDSAGMGWGTFEVMLCPAEEPALIDLPRKRPS
jgi:hypothetical protein